MNTKERRVSKKTAARLTASDGEMSLTRGHYRLNTYAGLLMSISGVFLITPLVRVLICVICIYDEVSLTVNLPVKHGTPETKSFVVETR